MTVRCGVTVEDSRKGCQTFSAPSNKYGVPRIKVARMKGFPNFKGAKILGFCLNVMGLTVSDKNYDYDSKALQKAILSWTKKNYAWLYSYNPRVAEACLVDGITYDAEHLRLVKTSTGGLRCEPEYHYFDADPPSPNLSS